VGVQKARKYAVLGREDVDSNGFIRMSGRGRIADETALRDLNTLVVPVQQVEGFSRQSQLYPVAPPVVVSWAKAAVVNHKAEIKKQRLTLHIDSHLQVNGIADESRVE
jgi:hypothetical protein